MPATFDRQVVRLKAGDRIICPNSGLAEEVLARPERRADGLWLVRTDRHDHPALFGPRRLRLA